MPQLWGIFNYADNYKSNALNLDNLNGLPTFLSRYPEWEHSRRRPSGPLWIQRHVTSGSSHFVSLQQVSLTESFPIGCLLNIPQEGSGFWRRSVQNAVSVPQCLCDLLAVVVLPASVLQRPLAPRTIEDMLEVGRRGLRTQRASLTHKPPRHPHAPPPPTHTPPVLLV